MIRSLPSLRLKEDGAKQIKIVSERQLCVRKYIFDDRGQSRQTGCGPYKGSSNNQHLHNSICERAKQPTFEPVGMCLLTSYVMYPVAPNKVAGKFELQLNGKTV